MTSDEGRTPEGAPERLCWRSRKPPPCATRDGRERLARSSSRWTRREQAARWNDGLKRREARRRQPHLRRPRQAKDRKIVVVEEEAERVRIIFRRYLELGSLNPTLAPLLLPRPSASLVAPAWHRSCRASCPGASCKPRSQNGEGPMPSGPSGEPSCAGLSPLTYAQETNWPSKTVTVVVGFGAGGATDVMARMPSRKLSEDDLKQAFVVENRVGGAGNVAATYVARSVPDGILYFSLPLHKSLLRPKIQVVGYDPIADFAPVSTCGSGPFILVIRPSIPVGWHDYMMIASN